MSHTLAALLLLTTSLVQFGPAALGQSTPRRPPYIMYSHYNEALKAINLDGTNETNLLPISPEIRPSTFDFDIRRGYAYWVEWPTRRIVRASLNNESDVVILHESTKPTDEERFVDVAIDWINNRLYYTDSIGDEIEVYDLNNDTYWTILNSTSELPLDPSTIAVDPINNWLYFNNYGQQKLERVSLSGGNRQVVITSGSRMQDIALDIANQQIYWSISDKIESCNVDGTGRTTVRAILPQPHPQQGISYFRGAIYYTNYYTIRYSASNGTGGETVLLTESTAIIYGLQVVDVSNQPLPAVFNECQTSLHNCDVNAICTDLEQGYTCRCKLGYVGDGLICTDKSVYPGVVSIPTEDQVCLSDEQRQIIRNRIDSDIYSILRTSNSTMFTSGN